MTINGATGERLLAAVNGVVYPLSREECVFRASATGEKHVMTMQVLQAMDLCSRFRSMDGHVSAVMNAIGELKGREEDVRRVLESLRNRGLMIGADEALSALEGDAKRPAGMAGVMVRTSGNAQALDRLLASLQRLNEAHGESHACYVVDDSKDRDSARECEKVCSRWRENGLGVNWLDAKWQQHFARQLQESSGVADEVVQWLLARRDADRFTGGRAWNLILLASAGRRAIVVDDDIVLDARAMQEPAGVALTDEGFDVHFHADAASAAESGQPLDADPVAEQLRFLGSPAPAAIKRLADNPGSLEGMDQRLIQALDGRSTVIGTVCGIYGDAATGGSNLWYYMLAGDSLERFRASREDYDRNRRSRWISRSRPRPGLVRHVNFSLNGLDGSRLLPPTLPEGRSEDRLYNSLLAFMHPRSRVLEFPWALGHFPEGERSWTFDPLKQPIGAGLSTFLSDTLMHAQEPMPGAEPATRLRLASEMMGDLAGRPDRELRDRLDEYLIYIRSNLVQGLQRQLNEQPNAPVYWAADVRSIIAANGRALTEDGFPRLSDMPADGSEAENLAWLRERLHGLADALRNWPALYEAARELDALPR